MVKDEKRKVLFICSAKPSYSRNAILISALKRKFEVQVISSSKNSYFLRIPEVWLKFIFAKNDYDYLLVGFLGQPLLPLAKLLARKPIIFDAFISLYDTLCFDRKTFTPYSIVGRIAYFLDKKSCEWAGKIITDTNQNINYFAKNFSIPKKKFCRVWVGSQTDLFYPREERKVKDKFIVFFYGTFIPLHGVEYIIRAAKLLEDEKDLLFKIVGRGQTYQKNYNLAQSLNLKNVIFLGRQPIKTLSDFMASADVCLGVFGDTEKAQRVIPNKVFDALASQKPVITTDTPAIRELLEDKKGCLLCQTANPRSLADAILLLKQNKVLRDKIAKNGYRKFIRHCSLEALSKTLNSFIKLKSDG